jgi:hypothetical protein
MKLAKLPVRKTTKITFNATAKLNDDLQIYSALYRDTYGDASSVPELIPYMLEAFLKSDPAFTKAQKDGSLNAAVEKQGNRARSLRTGKGAPAAVNIQATQTKEA